MILRKSLQGLTHLRPGIIAVFCMSVTSTLSQPFTFTLDTIGITEDRMGQTSLVDLDNDGDLDWAFGRRGEMYWFEFVSSHDWSLHEMGKGAYTDVGGTPSDINKDGWMDYVVGDSWYEHPGKAGEGQFILHKKNMIKTHDNVMADIDEDGIEDIISLSNDRDHPVLAWYKVTANTEANWDYQKIGTGIHGGVAPRGVGDLDGDGDLDIVRGDVWFEHLDGDGKEWQSHKTLVPEGGSRPGKPGLALRTICVDLDNDGDLDIVQAEADTGDGRAFWFENVNGADHFIYHLISANHTGQDLHSLIVADLDNDGDLDIASGGGPLSSIRPTLMIWEHRDGKGLQWHEITILTGHYIHEAVAADVDRDGDVDICSKPWRSGVHIFLENQIVSK